MFTLITTIISFGFFLCYSTTKRVPVKPILVIEKLNSNHKYTNGLGVFFMSIALSLTIVALGVGNGIFSFIILLMTVASCIVLLYPLNVIKNIHLLIIFCISLGLEML
ncbi:hypothetical protein SAMN05216480_11140 [Pustulibacterium marinum]|uniref:Uncharacterized protein n=1 Tax=Pustulibacterium marinum TaxID=1224947 RepID=A0A1I7HUS5_9FLAO|nr:hypothetical protein [Pustulibacterium marinum]SFU64453.1 hypothetical protein SAMN05216480_11140 [Pustulibacterium marinum]